MCHLGTSQGIQVMRIFKQFPSTLLATGMAALFLGNMVVANTAQASLEITSDNPSSSDKFLVIHSLYGKDVMVRSNFSVLSVETLESSAKTNTNDIKELKKDLEAQARLIEELKRNNGTSSTSSASEIANLKQANTEQEKNLKELTRQLEELKRNSGSSSSSSSSEVANLKRTVSEQDNDLKRLASQVEDLKRSAGSNSNASASDLSSLKRDVSNQDSQLDQLKRAVDDLRSKVK
jgi:DNA repair exonuclease SbcCD ATPase subunit